MHNADLLHYDAMVHTGKIADLFVNSSHKAEVANEQAGSEDKDAGDHIEDDKRIPLPQVGGDTLQPQHYARDTTEVAPLV